MANRYWVGDGGNWHDTAHWSSSSGGSGGSSVPGASDNAFFDANSFSSSGQTVLLPDYVMTPTNIHDLSLAGVTNSPTFSQVVPDIVSLFVFGSITGAPGVAFNVFIKMEASSPQTIDPQGMVFNSSSFFIVNNADPSSPITLLSSLVVTGIFECFGPIVFDANGFDVTCAAWDFNTNDFLPATVSMGSGSWTIKPVLSTSLIFFGGGNASRAPAIDPGTSTLILDLSAVSGGTSTFNTFIDYTFSAVEVIGNGSTNQTLYFLGENISADSLATTGEPFTIKFSGGKTYSFPSSIMMNGSSGKLIKLRTNVGTATLSTNSGSFSFIDTANIIATGVAVPFDDSTGGLDGGGNTGWIFPPAPVSANLYLQNVFMIGSDTDGKVQMFNVGKGDDGTPIFYELETQELEFGSRAHLKGISDEIAVFTNFGGGSSLEAWTDTQDPTPVDMQFNERVNIGKNINLEGHYVTFRWFGESSTVSPIFEGLYIENIADKGMTEP